MRDDPLQSVLGSSEKLVRLEPEEVERADKLGEKIVEAAADLEKFVVDVEDRAKYGGIYAR